MGPGVLYVCCFLYRYPVIFVFCWIFTLISGIHTLVVGPQNVSFTMVLLATTSCRLQVCPQTHVGPKLCYQIVLLGEAKNVFLLCFAYGNVVGLIAFGYGPTRFGEIISHAVALAPTYWGRILG